MIRLPMNIPDYPTFRQSVDQRVTAGSLRAAAAATRDPATLLGLAVLARAGDPVRVELATQAVQANPEYGSAVAVLSVVLDRIDLDSAGELVRRDPGNALGHYLRGTLLHAADRPGEALDAFRKAAACSDLRLHDSATGEAVRKALDALNLQGLDRLCALSWTITRWMNFSSLGIQPVHWALAELARPADTPTRFELAEILIGFAGHLFATNFANRWHGQRALEAAFLLKAELAAAESLPKMNGYAAALQGLSSAMFYWPGLEDPEKPKPQQVALFLPSRIHRAFAAADPALMNEGVLGETNLHPPESDRAAFEAAKQRATAAAQKLVDVALTDPDGILGAYLQGLPQPASPRPGPGPSGFSWASFSTPVGSLMEKRPDVFRAAADYEEAMNSVWRVGQSDPAQRNIRQLMDIAWALQSHAQNHDGLFPDSLAALFEPGLLKPSLQPISLLTGRPYVYVAAGEKRPANMRDQARFVLVYDDEPTPSGCYACAFASCGGGQMRVAELQEQLRNRGN